MPHALLLVGGVLNTSAENAVSLGRTDKRPRMRGTVAEVATLRNHSAAEPHRLAWSEAIRKAGLIPHLVRLATAAVEEARKAAEAAGTLTSLAEAAALQQTTPTEKPASLFSLYQATQALQEQAASHRPTVPEVAASEAEAAGTLAKLARAEGHEGKQAAPLARGAMRPDQRQVLAAVMQPVEKSDPGRSLSVVSTPQWAATAHLPAAAACSAAAKVANGRGHLRPPSHYLPPAGRGGGRLPRQHGRQQRRQPGCHRRGGGRAAHSRRAARHARWLKELVKGLAWSLTAWLVMVLPLVAWSLPRAWPPV